MHTTYLVVAAVAVLANGFSGVGALARIRPALAGMDAVGVPHSWIVFPIGTLKTLGALGLLAGLLGVPAIGTAAAGGLVLFFACAVHTHLLARDYSPQLALASTFLALDAVTLALGLAA